MALIRRQPAALPSRCEIEICNTQREVKFPLKKESLQTIVDIVLEMEKREASFVSLSFLSDQNMRKYHATYFSDPSSTDCMSFPLDSEINCTSARHLGEVIVCPVVAVLRSQGDRLRFWRELTLYFVHGLLHLLGYDDQEPQDRALMRRKERQVLKRLEQKNILLSGSVTYTLSADRKSGSPVKST